MEYWIVLAPDKYSGNWILVYMLVGRVLRNMKKYFIYEQKNEKYIIIV